MLCSIHGAGKSVCAEKYAKDHKNTIIHSSDALREELFGNVNDQNNNEVLFTELHRRIKADLSAGKNVIYDADHYNILFDKDIIDIIADNKDRFTDFEIIKGSMDDVFLNLTGRMIDN